MHRVESLTYTATYLLVTSVATIGIGLLPAIDARAQYPVKLTPSLSANLMWTDNVELAPRELAVSDFVLTLTPGLAIDHETPRSMLRGYVALPVLLYARTGSENNEVQPLVDVDGRLEVVKDFLFIEASASVQQSFFNPFGPRPIGLDNATRNRIQEQTYRVSPYVRGVIGGTTSYELRNDNIWTLLDDAPFGAQREYITRWFGTVNKEPAPYGIGADAERTVYRFEDQATDQYIELARLRGVYQPSPTWRVFGTVGYERNRFTLAESDGPIYGGGFWWRPSERSLVDVFAEHRFFGTSYAATLDHRTPLSTWNLRAYRNITTSPELLARLPAGSFVPGVLNELLRNRIPDPADRAQFIATYMQQQNIPVVVSEPATLYSQRIILEEFVGGAVGLLGTRNTVVLSIYRNDVQPITGSGTSLPPAATALYDYTEDGAGVTWTYAMTSQSSLTSWLSTTRTVGHSQFTGESSQWALRLSWNRTVSPRTSLIAGSRYQEFDSEFGGRTSEAAVFVGITHTFR